MRVGGDNDAHAVTGEMASPLARAQSISAECRVFERDQRIQIRCYCASYVNASFGKPVQSSIHRALDAPSLSRSVRHYTRGLRGTGLAIKTAH